MRLPGLGPKSAAKIWKELGITTVADLRTAAEAEQLRTLSGFGARTEERILHALSQEATLEPVRPLLGAGLAPVLAVVEVLRAHPAADLVSEAGSVRRRKETFRDLDVIATAKDPRALIDYFVALEWVAEVAAHGDTKATVVSHDGLRFDLRVVPPESFGNLLQHFTGSKDHNVALREAAVKQGLSISEYGVKTVETGEVFTTRDEAELYEFLGYQYIPPELRENLGELDAARKGELPELVEVKHVRGDLHVHSTWSSDGKNTIEEMARRCIERGYQYMAITDHSHYLREGRLEAQWREVEQLNEKLAPFRILRGIEANIRANGEVDVADELLARARLGRRVAAPGVRQEPDRADHQRDGAPARPLHRASDRAEDQQARSGRRRRRARDREGARDEDVPRAELAARPSRPARRQRAPRGGGGPEDPRGHRRAPDQRARLDGDRDRAGPPRVADEGPGAEHAHLEADREAEEALALDREPRAEREREQPPDHSVLSRSRSSAGEPTTTSAPSSIPRGPSSETTPTRTPHSISSSARNASRSVESSPA